MPYDKPKVTIDLDEYNDLINQKSFEVRSQQLEYVIAALVNSGANTTAAANILTEKNIKLTVGEPEIFFDNITGSRKVIPLHKIKVETLK